MVKVKSIPETERKEQEKLEKILGAVNVVLPKMRTKIGRLFKRVKVFDGRKNIFNINAYGILDLYSKVHFNDAMNFAEYYESTFRENVLLNKHYMD